MSDYRTTPEITRDFLIKLTTLFEDVDSLQALVNSGLLREQMSAACHFQATQLDGYQLRQRAAAEERDIIDLNAKGEEAL